MLVPILGSKDNIAVRAGLDDELVEPLAAVGDVPLVEGAVVRARDQDAVVGGPAHRRHVTAVPLQVALKRKRAPR